MVWLKLTFNPKGRQVRGDGWRGLCRFCDHVSWVVFEDILSDELCPVKKYICVAGGHIWNVCPA